MLQLDIFQHEQEHARVCCSRDTYTRIWYCASASMAARGKQCAVSSAAASEGSALKDNATSCRGRVACAIMLYACMHICTHTTYLNLFPGSHRYCAMDHSHVP